MKWRVANDTSKNRLVHIHTLYLILLIVTLNLLVSLFLILFRLQVSHISNESFKITSKEKAALLSSTTSLPNSFSGPIIQPEAATMAAIGVVERKKEKFYKLGFKLSSVYNPATLLLATHQHTTTASSAQMACGALLVDCKTERNNQDEQKCRQWRAAGFCERQAATKYLFCRKECFCFNPSSE